MKSRVLLLATVALVASTNVSAKDTGLYIGAAIGAANSQYSDAAVDIDSTNVAYKLFGGYQFNGLLAIEGGYNNFGSPTGSGEEIDIDGFDLFAVAGIPIGPLRAFGKAGVIAWDASTSNGVTSSDDGTDYAVGVAGEFELFSIGWRLEVEYFDINDGITQGTLGVTYTF